MAVKTVHSPPASLQTRPATDDDVPAIVTLGRREFTKAFACTMTEHDLEVYLAETYTAEHILNALHDPQQTWNVATTESGCAGFAVLRRGSSDPAIAQYLKTIELLRLYVDSHYHGCGVAKLLLETSMKFATSQGHETIWLGVYEENHRAKRFYQKFDFQFVGSHDFWTGSTVTTDLVMVKPLV